LECKSEKYDTGKNSLEPNGWAVAAMNGAQRNGLRTMTKHREPPASGARVVQKYGLRKRKPLQHMCEVERRFFVNFLYTKNAEWN